MSKKKEKPITPDSLFGAIIEFAAFTRKSKKLKHHLSNEALVEFLLNQHMEQLAEDIKVMQSRKNRVITFDYKETK